MDAFEALHQSHEEAKAAFHKIQQANSTDRAGIWAKLHPELVLHEKTEDQFVYDPMMKDVGSGHPQLSQFHQQHEQQVKMATQLMDRIGSMEPSDAAWLSTVGELQQALTQHISMEENQFWPLIRQTWGQQHLDDAGGKVQGALTAGKAGATASGLLGQAEQAIKDLGRKAA